MKMSGVKNMNSRLSTIKTEPLWKGHHLNRSTTRESSTVQCSLGSNVSCVETLRIKGVNGHFPVVGSIIYNSFLASYGNKDGLFQVPRCFILRAPFHSTLYFQAMPAGMCTLK